jgi:hypothetical protein
MKYLLCLAVGLPALAQPQEGCVALLTGPQKDSLQKVDPSQGEYEVAVYAGRVGEDLRTVVVFGDSTSFKSEDDVRLAQEVLSQFEVYGFEGRMPSNHFSHKLELAVARQIFRFTKADKRPWFEKQRLFKI